MAHKVVTLPQFWGGSSSRVGALKYSPEEVQTCPRLLGHLGYVHTMFPSIPRVGWSHAHILLSCSLLTCSKFRNVLVKPFLIERGRTPSLLLFSTLETEVSGMTVGVLPPEWLHYDISGSRIQWMGSAEKHPSLESSSEMPLGSVPSYVFAHLIR